MVAARTEGDKFQQVYAHQQKESTWCLVGGGIHPLVAARVRPEHVEGGDRMFPSGFRGPSDTSRKFKARQHSIAIE